MRTSAVAVLAMAALALLAREPGSAHAQGKDAGKDAGLVRNPNVRIDYIEPEDPARLNIDPNSPSIPARTKTQFAKLVENYALLNGARERLMKAQLLERYSQFLAPLNLPVTLRLRAQQCNQRNAFYSPNDTSITLCYEYVLAFEANVPKETTPQGITRQDALTGSIVSTLLHETGHALFSIYRIPILGREEDAADQIAAYVMMQFGTAVALTTVKGAAWKWGTSDWSDPTYHDVHSTPQQRFYNFLCMAYGGNRDAFKQFVDIGWLPKWRAPNCANEYQQAKLAFDGTVLPHVDPALMEKVHSGNWLQPSEMAPGPIPLRRDN